LSIGLSHLSAVRSARGSSSPLVCCYRLNPFYSRESSESRSNREFAKQGHLQNISAATILNRGGKYNCTFPSLSLIPYFRIVDPGCRPLTSWHPHESYMRVMIARPSPASDIDSTGGGKLVFTFTGATSFSCVSGCMASGKPPSRLFHSCMRIPPPPSRYIHSLLVVCASNPVQPYDQSWFYCCATRSAGSLSWVAKSSFCRDTTLFRLRRQWPDKKVGPLLQYPTRSPLPFAIVYRERRQ